MPPFFFALQNEKMVCPLVGPMFSAFFPLAYHINEGPNMSDYLLQLTNNSQKYIGQLQTTSFISVAKYVQILRRLKILLKIKQQLQNEILKPSAMK